MKNSFYKIIGRKFGTISTVDHPYTSPPIHLFDAHLNLLNTYGSDVQVLNWDVSLPGDRTYRYDLITDTGLIAKTSNLYHYRLDVPYNNQIFDPNPWALLPQYIPVAMKMISEKHHLSRVTIQETQERAFNVINIAHESYHPEAWLYTRNLLKNYYLLFDKPELSNFISHQYTNYWMSSFMADWIPWCILNANGPLSFYKLLNSDIFLRTPFRHVKQGYLEDSEIQDPVVLIEKIRNGLVIPSFDIFLWSLTIAQINHYGNDFGFFERLSKFTGIESIAQLQVTKTGEDAKRFLKLSMDYGILFKTVPKTNEIIPSNYHPAKSTRINSFSSLYVIGGESVLAYLSKYSRSSSLDNEQTVHFS